ncbi:hypothetical protein ACO0SA_000011 [Hanseniaspora valbyensis]
MPVGKSLAKVTKSIGNNKHKVHPRGRKLQQLERATLRDEQLEKKKRQHADNKTVELLRYSYIQDLIKSEDLAEENVFTRNDIAKFIELFIARDDEEIAELKKAKRNNRPPTNRQLLLEQRKKAEIQEFTIGFMSPDLTDADSVKALRNWNGTFGSLNQVKKFRLKKDLSILGESKTPKDIEM